MVKVIYRVSFLCSKSKGKRGLITYPQTEQTRGGRGGIYGANHKNRERSVNWDHYYFMLLILDKEGLA